MFQAPPREGLFYVVGWIRRLRRHPAMCAILPDGAALIRPTGKSGCRPDKAFTPSSGNKLSACAAKVKCRVIPTSKVGWCRQKETFNYLIYKMFVFECYRCC
ncbi:hypothetical protein CO701_05080 [Citrobacter werkmanii]|nr:hypothetical protein CO701_05080 [Citrobacter werkmanii]